MQAQIFFKNSAFELPLKESHDDENDVILQSAYTLQEQRPLAKPPYLLLIARTGNPQSKNLRYTFYNYTHAGNGSVIIHGQVARCFGNYADFVNHKPFVPVEKIVRVTENIGIQSTTYMSEREYVKHRALACDEGFDITQCVDPELENLLLLGILSERELFAERIAFLLA